MTEKCMVCKKIIPIEHERLGAMNKETGEHFQCCMGCEGAIIPVFRVTLNQGDKGGLIEKKLDGVCELLKEMDIDNSYYITKEEMHPLHVATLEEFKGF